MQLNERSVLMQFSAGLPGQARKDKRTTAEIQTEKGLGANSGKWIKELWPPKALEKVKALQNEARDYHETVTFPFGGSDEDKGEANGGDQAENKRKRRALSGVGILPVGLIMEYTDKMREFRSKQEVLVADFLREPADYVNWARREHNGTFDPKNYPGCKIESDGSMTFDEARFRKVIGEKFYLETSPLPVPQAEHFSQTIAQLLGQDAESVNLRVADAERESQRELLRRMMDPIQHMASKLAGQPCGCRACKGAKGKTDNFKDSLVANVQTIAQLVPKMNLGGDPTLDSFAREMEALSRYAPDTLRDDKATRNEAADKAAELFKRLEGYKI